MKDEKIVSINTFGNLCETREFIRVLEGISEHNPEKVIIIDPFRERNFDQVKILSNLIGYTNRELIFHSFENEFNVPDGIEVLRNVEILKVSISTSQEVLVFIPRTIRHVLFATAVLKGFSHPAFNEIGKLSSDARWIIRDRKHSGDFDAMLQRSASYAMPYPDLTGDGKELLDEFDAGIIGLNYFMDEGFVREFVENSVRIAENPKRCYRNSYTGVIEVNATSADSFHSGALMAIIKEKWPEAKWVVIRSHGNISRKTGKPQVSIACIDEGENFDKFRNLKGEINFVSDMYVHMSSDLFSSITFP